MADIFQGNMKSISPAIGPYTINTYINIDKGVAGLTGPAPTGMVLGDGTLEPYKWMQGVTGIDGANFNTNTGTNY